MKPLLYLASQSPRRRQLLEQWGVRCELLLPDADEDVEALVDEQLELSAGLWELVGVQVTTGSHTVPTATVTLKDAWAKIEKADAK